MLERGRGRIVITGSGAAYLPGSSNTAYSASKAAVWRYGETLAQSLHGRIPVFVISPGLVRTDMTAPSFRTTRQTPPELAPRLVRALASGRADRLAGRYIHAEHDDVDDLIARADAIERDDLNAIRCAPRPGRGSRARAGELGRALERRHVRHVRPDHLARAGKCSSRSAIWSMSGASASPTSSSVGACTSARRSLAGGSGTPTSSGSPPAATAAAYSS